MDETLIQESERLSDEEEQRLLADAIRRRQSIPGRIGSGLTEFSAEYGPAAREFGAGISRGEPDPEMMKTLLAATSVVDPTLLSDAAYAATAWLQGNKEEAAIAIAASLGGLGVGAGAAKLWKMRQAVKAKAAAKLGPEGMARMNAELDEVFAKVARDEGIIAQHPSVAGRSVPVHGIPTNMEPGVRGGHGAAISRRSVPAGPGEQAVPDDEFAEWAEGLASWPQKNLTDLQQGLKSQLESFQQEVGKQIKYLDDLLSSVKAPKVRTAPLIRSTGGVPIREAPLTRGSYGSRGVVVPEPAGSPRMPGETSDVYLRRISDEKRRHMERMARLEGQDVMTSGGMSASRTSLAGGEGSIDGARAALYKSRMDAKAMVGIESAKDMTGRLEYEAGLEDLIEAYAPSRPPTGGAAISEVVSGWDPISSAGEDWLAGGKAYEDFMDALRGTGQVAKHGAVKRGAKRGSGAYEVADLDPYDERLLDELQELTAYEGGHLGNVDAAELTRIARRRKLLAKEWYDIRDPWKTISPRAEGKASAENIRLDLTPAMRRTEIHQGGADRLNLAEKRKAFREMTGVSEAEAIDLVQPGVDLDTQVTSYAKRRGEIPIEPPGTPGPGWGGGGAVEFSAEGWGPGSPRRELFEEVGRADLTPGQRDVARKELWALSDEEAEAALGRYRKPSSTQGRMSKSELEEAAREVDEAHEAYLFRGENRPGLTGELHPVDQAEADRLLGRAMRESSED